MKRFAAILRVPEIQAIIALMIVSFEGMRAGLRYPVENYQTHAVISVVGLVVLVMRWLRE